MPAGWSPTGTQVTDAPFRVRVVTLFPELIAYAARVGVVGRAERAGRFALETIDPRDFATDRHRRVDDAPFGGGPGMVLKADVLGRAIAAARAGPPSLPVAALTARGTPLTQALAAELAAGPGCTLVCGRYEGFDERTLETAVDLEISVGDFVVSGGEIPALLVLDAMVRLLPGALGNVASAGEESFAEGLVEYPQFTRPRSLAEDEVPATLLSGDHAAIARWRRRAALGRTWLLRPDLIDPAALSAADAELLEEFIDEFRRLRRARGLWFDDEPP